MLSHISLEYERFFKTVFEKVFANVWVIFTARPQRDLCILPLGQRPGFEEVEDSMGFSWPGIHQYNYCHSCLCSCCSSLTFSWRSQILRNVDAEAWSKLSVFCKAEVCFSTQSLTAQKQLGRVFAPACYLLSTWFSFEDFFFFKSV